MAADSRKVQPEEPGEATGNHALLRAPKGGRAQKMKINISTLAASSGNQHGINDAL
jgi:hypothetical protein